MSFRRANQARASRTKMARLRLALWLQENGFVPALSREIANQLNASTVCLAAAYINSGEVEPESEVGR